jgi:hypothetical protein
VNSKQYTQQVLLLKQIQAGLSSFAWRFIAFIACILDGGPAILDSSPLSTCTATERGKRRMEKRYKKNTRDN